MDKKAWAANLYTTGAYTQEFIARELGVSQASVAKSCRDFAHENLDPRVQEFLAARDALAAELLAEYHAAKAELDAQVAEYTRILAGG